LRARGFSLRHFEVTVKRKRSDRAFSGGGPVPVVVEDAVIERESDDDRLFAFIDAERKFLVDVLIYEAESRNFLFAFAKTLPRDTDEICRVLISIMQRDCNTKIMAQAPAGTGCIYAIVTVANRGMFSRNNQEFIYRCEPEYSRDMPGYSRDVPTVTAGRGLKAEIEARGALTTTPVAIAPTGRGLSWNEIEALSAGSVVPKPEPFLDLDVDVVLDAEQAFFAKDDMNTRVQPASPAPQKVTPLPTLDLATACTNCGIVALEISDKEKRCADEAACAQRALLRVCDQILALPADPEDSLRASFALAVEASRKASAAVTTRLPPTDDALARLLYERSAVIMSRGSNTSRWAEASVNDKRRWLALAAVVRSVAYASPDTKPAADPYAIKLDLE
jgi:hypothetical protein